MVSCYFFYKNIFLEFMLIFILNYWDIYYKLPKYFLFLLFIYVIHLYTLSWLNGASDFVRVWKIILRILPEEMIQYEQYAFRLLSITQCACLNFWIAKLSLVHLHNSAINGLFCYDAILRVCASLSVISNILW